MEIVEFDCGGQPISDDVVINYYHKKISVPMFSFAFNSSYVKGGFLRLAKVEGWLIFTECVLISSYSETSMEPTAIK